MKRKQLLTLALALLLLFPLAACSKAAEAPAPEEPETDKYYAATSDFVSEPAPEEALGLAPQAGELAEDTEATSPPVIPGGGDGSVYVREDAKLIRTADLTFETLEFDKAVQVLDALVIGHKGYYENSDVWGGAYEGATRSGSYVVRIPKEAYDAFMGAVGDIGQVTRRSESSQDVGKDYADMELRLKTMNKKHERLLALLDKATDMESIVALQGYLADVEYEIDYYSGTLRNYDSLVGYATIHIELQEKGRLSSETGEKAGFGSQLGTALGNGFSGFKQAVKSLILFLAYNLMGILFLAVLVAVGLVLWRKKLGALVREKRSSLPGTTEEAPKDYSKPKE